MFLESWRLTEDFQTLVWSKNRPIGIQKAYSLDQFDLQVRVLDIQNVKYMTGNFSQLGVVLIFSRKLQFYILQIYFPTVLFVIISWLTFIIPPAYAQGRIILTITTMLTLAALFTLST
ncbi:glutamate-gated chloride channel-like [Amphibalanus amphitrite]|uniref:glutamate-gated chloride channel-like n=1 Tax=Amphibalanus amphitrite TaxID=1232801 RepID=UPI001C915C2C|nr:glutamate-gated chloride channel-like [Amphibalanus amphitrite]